MDAVDECRRHIEVRLTKPRERRLKIEQSLLMGLGQDAQGTGDEQVRAFGFGAPFALVDQEAVGIERQRECDRRAFAGIEKLEGWIGRWVRPDLTPVRRLRDPGPDSVRRIGLLQLTGDGLRHEHACVKRLEHTHCSY